MNQASANGFIPTSPLYDLYDGGGIILPLMILLVFAVLVFGGFLLLKLVFGGGTASSKVDSVKRGYYYLVSFITLAVLYFSFSSLVETLLTGMTQNNYYGSSSYDYFARAVAMKVATLMVTLPVYIFHWNMALKGTEEVSDPEAKNYEIKERRLYTQVVLFFSTVVLLFTGIRFVYLLLLLGLGGSGIYYRDFIFPLSYAPGILAIWLYHTKLLSQPPKRQENIRV